MRTYVTASYKSGLARPFTVPLDVTLNGKVKGRLRQISLPRLDRTNAVIVAENSYTGNCIHTLQWNNQSGT